MIRSDLARTFTPHRGLETLDGNFAAPFRAPRNLTTGTFNLVVKDRIAFPPERRVFSPGELTKVNPTVLETFQKYRSARQRVNLGSSQDFHMKPGFRLQALGFRHERRGFRFS